MNAIIGEFRLGEDLAIALDALSGDPSGVIAITAAMKPAAALGNRLEVDHGGPPTALEALSRGAEGWTLSLPAAASAALAPGVYGIDARLVLPGGIEITEQTAFVALSRAAVA